MQIRISLNPALGLNDDSLTCVEQTFEGRHCDEGAKFGEDGKHNRWALL